MRENERERLRETRNDLRKLTQTEGKGRNGRTLAHVPQTEDPQIVDRATKVVKSTVDTHAVY